MKRTVLWTCFVVCGLTATISALMVLVGLSEGGLDISLGITILSGALTVATWKSYRTLCQTTGKQSDEATAHQKKKEQAHDCFLDRSQILDIPVDIIADGNYDFEIVGESNYQHAIARTLPIEAKSADKVRAYTVATIETENDNEYDSKAVVVKIDRRVVGYLARDDARRYRRWLSKNAVPDPATCRSTIVGTNTNGFGIWLDMPIDNT